MKTILVWGAIILGTMGMMLLFAAAEPAERAAMGWTERTVHTAEQGGQQAKHLLEWGLFAVAAGEVAGAIGQGLNHMRTNKRREAAKAQETRQTTTLHMFPEYERYCPKLHQEVA